MKFGYKDTRSIPQKTPIVFSSGTPLPFILDLLLWVVRVDGGLVDEETVGLLALPKDVFPPKVRAKGIMTWEMSERWKLGWRRV